MNWKKAGGFLGAACLLLSGCSGPDSSSPGPVTGPSRATQRPYVIKGKQYVPQKHFKRNEVGMASYYGGRDGTHGRPTASGERYNMHALTAAHKELPLPSVALIENLENGRKVVVRVNDRGPFPSDHGPYRKGPRIVDVSVAAAKALGFYGKGTAKVRLCCLEEESLQLPENRAFARMFRTSLKCARPPAALCPRPRPRGLPVTLAAQKVTPPPIKRFKCYYLGFGHCTSKAHAQKLLNHCKRLGPAKVVPRAGGLTVLVGPFGTQQEVRALMRLASCHKVPMRTVIAGH